MAAVAKRQPCGGPLGVFAVAEHNGEDDELHYVYKDHLGSWTTITYASGVVEREQSFDAWGNMRDPETWSGDYDNTLMFDRGYTGHEHLYSFGLINMNGRVYDPVMSSFLSPDNYIQAPDFSQSFNRYAYCLNNPLKYTDPSGESIVLAVLVGAFWSSAMSLAVNFDNISTDADFVNVATLGALGGAVGGAAGFVAGGAVAGVLGTEGAIPGFLTSASGGFAGSLAGTSVTSWCTGSTFGDGLMAGLKAGAISGLTAGLIGAHNGAIDAINAGGEMWTGKINDDVIIEYLGGGKGIRLETDYNNSMAAKYNDEWLQQKSLDRMKAGVGDFDIKRYTTTLNSDNSLVSQYSFATTGQYLNKDGYLVNGFRCKYPSGGSELHISPGCLYATDMEFDATVGHELIHAFHYYKIKNPSTLYSERVAHEYSYNVYQTNGFYTTAKNQLLNSIKLGFGPGPYPSEYIIPSKYPFSINYLP